MPESDIEFEIFECSKIGAQVTITHQVLRDKVERRAEVDMDCDHNTACGVSKRNWFNTMLDQYRRARISVPLEIYKDIESNKLFNWQIRHDTQYPLEGALQFRDVTVDPAIRRPKLSFCGLSFLIRRAFCCQACSSGWWKRASTRRPPSS